MNKNEGYTVNDNFGLMGPAGVASTNDTAYFSWSDSRRGTVETPVEDYYFTTARFGGTKSTSTSLTFATGVATGLLAAGVVLVAELFVVRARRRRIPVG